MISSGRQSSRSSSEGNDGGRQHERPVSDVAAGQKRHQGQNQRIRNTTKAAEARGRKAAFVFTSTARSEKTETATKSSPISAPVAPAAAVKNSR